MQTPEQYREHIRYVCDLWSRHEDAGASFRGEIARDTAVAIHTLAHHAVQLAEALLVIDERMPGVTVMPTVRLIYECGVTCAWLLLTPKSGATLLRDGAKMRKTALNELVAQGFEAGPGLAQTEQTLERLGVELPDLATATFQARCLALHDGPRLYAMYRIFTAQSHAGMSLVDAWVQEDDSSPIGMSFDPDPEFTTRAELLGIAGVMVFLAVNADAQARRHPHQTAQLRKVAKRLETTTLIRRADGSGLLSRKKGS